MSLFTSYRRGSFEPKQAPCTKRQADSPIEEIASDAVQKRRPRAVETKQRATAGSTRLPEPKGRWPGIVEEGSRHQVSQSLDALISKPAVRLKISQRTAVTIA